MILGPILPYLGEEEGISYLVGALHQVAYAVGGGLAGLLAARKLVPGSRRALIAAGLTGAGLAGLALGYATTPPATIGAALAMSLLGTTALIAVWAALADLHGPRRAVAMTEGEVPVSLAGALVPVLVSGLATTVLDWRFAFVVAAAWAAAAAGLIARTSYPPPKAPPSEAVTPSRRRKTPPPTLVLGPLVVALEFALSFWLASYLNEVVGLPRDSAVLAVSGLYLANLVGRLLTSRLVRRVNAGWILAAALTTVLIGLPFLLAAQGIGVAAVGIAITGAGIGALFPLASALHIQATARTADAALGQTLATVSVGQMIGPLAVGVIAQAVGLRAGFLVLPALTVMAALALVATVVTERRP